MSAETSLDIANATEDTAPGAKASPAAGGLDALVPKMEVQGVIKRVELQGAIVDLELGYDGLLHISQLNTETVKNVSDVINVGDKVTAYVLAVDKNKGRIDLTLIKPLGLMWNEIKVNQVYDGTVVRIEKFGVFIDIGAERPGMIHVSELANGYVANPSDIVKVGDTIQAKLIGVNRRKKQIDLSVRAIEQVEAIQVEEETEEEEAPTAMELALRRAMESGEIRRNDQKQQKKRSKKKAVSDAQSDILTRTLRMHSDN